MRYKYFKIGFLFALFTTIAAFPSIILATNGSQKKDPLEEGELLKKIPQELKQKIETYRRDFQCPSVEELNSKVEEDIGYPNAADSGKLIRLKYNDAGLVYFSPFVSYLDGPRQRRVFGNIIHLKSVSFSQPITEYNQTAGFKCEYSTSSMNSRQTLEEITLNLDFKASGIKANQKLDYKFQIGPDEGEKNN